MYNYQELKPELFTEHGQVMFMQIRDKAKDLLKSAGCFRMDKAMQGASFGDSWTMLACVDRLVELKEIKEVTDKEKVSAQYRIFTNSH